MSMKVIANGIEVDAAKLLSALHNGTQPLGMGHLHDIGHLSVTGAESVLKVTGRFEFDYLLYGRPLKVYARDGVVDGRLYDRDAGPGAFARAVDLASK